MAQEFITTMAIMVALASWQEHHVTIAVMELFQLSQGPTCNRGQILYFCLGAAEW